MLKKASNLYSFFYFICNFVESFQRKIFLIYQ